jgi:hypothetical protein
MIIQGLTLNGGLELDPPPPSALFIAGAPYNDADYNNGGRAYILGGDSQIVLSDANGGTNRYFGVTSGAINASADLVVVSNQNSYISAYDLAGNNLYTLTESSGGADRRFGRYLALSATKLIASDPYFSSAGAGSPGYNRGKIYVYDQDGTNKVEISSPTPTAPNETFGDSLAVTDAKIACGASNMDGGKGALFIMNYDGSSMVKIVPAVQDFDDYLSAVSINSTKIAGGARSSGNDNQGAAYVFNHDGTGEVKIVPSVSQGGMYFGWSTAMTQTKLIVGSPELGGGTGAVYVFNLDGTGEVKITPSDGVSGDAFGRSISVTPDNKIVVGSPSSDPAAGQSAGKVYTYNLDGSGETIYQPDTPQAFAQFGTMVAG